MPSSEEEELIDELVRAWVEVYKKSAATLVLLRFIANQGPVGTPSIAEALASRTGWEIAERALYRSLRRLSGLGLLTVHQQPGHRTGAQRHLYEITDRGDTYLQHIEKAQIQT